MSGILRWLLARRNVIIGIGAVCMLVILAAVLLSAAARPSPAVEPTPTETLTPEPTPTETASPTATFTPLPTPTPTVPVLVGRVVDLESRAPIAGAQVAVGEQQAETNAEGRYSLPGVAPQAVVSVHATGYEAREVLWKGESPLNVALERERIIVWLRDDESGLPILGGTVRAVASGATSQTNKWGTALVVLNPGETLRASADGYADVELVYDGRKQVYLFLKPYAIQGTVRDALTGDSIPDLRITLHSHGQVRVTTTDQDGVFRFSHVPLTSTLSITAGGYISLTQVVTASLPATITLTLEPLIYKGVYIPFGLLYAPEAVYGILDMVDRTELNAIVVDVKSDRGRLAYQSGLEIAIQGEAYASEVMDLNELLRACKERGIYAIARLVTFKDPILAKVKPEWAITRKSGKLYLDGEELPWGDPYKQEVRDYNISIAKEVAALGFDEIQFDYIRFPSDGIISDIEYGITSTRETRTAAIARFCEEAHTALSAMDVMMSIDIFGLVTWVDTDWDEGIGQRLVDLARHVDYVSPMVYPSTYASGHMGYKEPARYPYEVVSESLRRAKLQTKTKLRPWLQHYSLWGIEYGTKELLAEKQAAEDAKTHGWLFWNAGGVYNEAVFAPATPTPTKTP